MKCAIVVFPGSNCERDCLYATRDVMGWNSRLAWHGEPLPVDCDLVIVPGGFSHGDYLRAGALAALSPIINDIRAHAERGGMLLGICNGFQVLSESGLLPGALVVNNDLRFHCEDSYLRCEHTDSPFTSACPPMLRIPIAHREGNFRASDAVIEELETEGRVLFRYADSTGSASPAANPNGSINNIAGIINRAGNVCGMMPHPERVCDPLLGGTDGKYLFESIAHALASTGGVG